MMRMSLGKDGFATMHSNGSLGVVDLREMMQEGRAARRGLSGCS